MALPGFKNTTNIRSIVLDASVRLAFIQLEGKYQTKRLDDLASISSGGTPSRTDSTLYGGDIPWAKIGDITAAGKWISDTEEYITESAIEQSSAKLFPVGTVFFSMYGSIGKTSIAKRPITTNQAILGLIPSDDISSEFLYYALINARESLFAQSKGTSQKNINGGMVKNFEIPVPPVDEQRKVVEFLSLVEDGEGTDHLVNLPDYLLATRRIVAHIESLAARVNEAQRLREEADVETDLLFSKATKDVFTKHLDSVTKIGDEFRVTTGGTPSRSNPSYWEGDVRWVSSGEVAFNKIYDTREKITEIGVSESNAKIYPPKTVLIAMIGQGKTRGQCAILECHAATNQNVAGIHVYETNHLPEYVHWWLRSRYLESRILEIGTAQPALSGERVKQMPIPLPPLDEQRRIVAYLDGLQAKVNALRGLQSQSQEELDALLPSVLDRAFKGEL